MATLFCGTKGENQWSGEIARKIFRKLSEKIQTQLNHVCPFGRELTSIPQCSEIFLAHRHADTCSLTCARLHRTGGLVPRRRGVAWSLRSHCQRAVFVVRVLVVAAPKAAAQVAVPFA